MDSQNDVGELRETFGSLINKGCAVHYRHIKVNQGEVSIWVRGKKIQSFFSICGFSYDFHLMRRPWHHHTDAFSRQHIIIYNQYFQHFDIHILSVLVK